MVCNSCRHEIDSDSVFCQSCGDKVTIANKVKKKTINQIKYLNKKITLWDKFVEIYESKEDNRKYFLDLSSDQAWEMVNRLSSNAFESFIQNNKDLLNKQPYKIIEYLKNIFTWCTSGGYWFWMAESFYNDVTPGNLRNVDLNELIKEWQELLDEKTYQLTDEVSYSMSMFHEYQFKNVMEFSESLKELPNEFIETLKSALIIQIIWGYVVAVAESKYRK